MSPTLFGSYARLGRPWLDLWMSSVRLGVESQAVIGMRVMGIATGTAPLGEASRMIPEKVAALADVQMLLARAAFTGRSPAAAEDVVRLYRSRVRANRRRLSKAA